MCGDAFSPVVTAKSTTPKCPAIALGFCAFFQGQHRREPARGPPYDIDLSEISRRLREVPFSPFGVALGARSLGLTPADFLRKIRNFGLGLLPGRRPKSSTTWCATTLS
jgi:hypothetical protein